MDMSLSLSTTTSRSFRVPALFIASYAMPADMAPSPMTQTTLRVAPVRSRATAIPSPAEMEVDEWPAPKASYSLSLRFVKPESGAGLAGDPEALLALDDEPQAASDGRVVVHDHDANGLIHLRPPVRR